jgi:hypothetical protein
MPTKAYDFIDSHTDAVEGWNKFGADEEGVEPMLAEGVGALGALASEPQAFRLFPTVDQRQILEEIRENPSFGRRIEKMLHHRDGVRMVEQSAKRAALNELDGKSFPESKGEWITLRKRLRVLARDIPAAIERGIEGMTLAEKTRALRAIAQGRGIALQLGADATTTAAPATGGSIWTSLITGIASAASSVYAAKITSDTQKDIAKIQTQSAATQASYANQIAQAQAALAAAQQSAAARASSGGEVAGIPLWGVVLGAVAVLGTIFYFVTRGR